MSPLPRMISTGEAGRTRLSMNGLGAGRKRSWSSKPTDTSLSVCGQLKCETNFQMKYETNFEIKCETKDNPSRYKKITYE
jgi:hypothetical protein